MCIGGLAARLVVSVVLVSACSVDVDGYRLAATASDEQPERVHMDASLAPEAAPPRQVSRPEAGMPDAAPPRADASVADAASSTPPPQAGCSNCQADSSTPLIPMPSKLWTASGAGQLSAGDIKLRLLVGPTLPHGQAAGGSYKLRLRSGFEQ